MTKSRVAGLLLVAAFVIGGTFMLPRIVRGQEKKPFGSVSTQQQTESTGSAAVSRSASNTTTPDKKLQIREGARINAELESTLDAKTAKPGDEVSARVTKDVKENGRTVIRKGDRLVGQIRDVEAGANAKAASRMAVQFDRVIQGEATSQLNTVVSAFLSTPREERTQREGMMESEPMPMMTSPGMVTAGAPPPTRSAGTRSSSSGGGLLGGVTSTVNSSAAVAGSAVGSVDATTNTVTSTAGSLTGNVNRTVNAAGQTQAGNDDGTRIATPLKAIRVGAETEAGQQASLTSGFSTRRGDLRLDSGTRLQFRVAAEKQKIRSDKEK